MTANAFIFSWCQEGIESIIPITQYEIIDKQNIFKHLKGENPTRNPMDSIIQSLILRARFNPQRHYEIYAVECDPSLDEEFWKKQWEEWPQEIADLIREKGHKIFSDRNSKHRTVIE